MANDCNYEIRAKGTEKAEKFVRSRLKMNNALPSDSKESLHVSRKRFHRQNENTLPPSTEA